MLIQDGMLLIVHEHPAGVVTANEPDEALAPAEIDVGFAVNVHAAADWLTVSVCPATVTLPVLEVPFGLTATVTVAVPLPEPLPLSDSHEVPVDDDHAQPLPAVTVTVND